MNGTIRLPYPLIFKRDFTGARKRATTCFNVAGDFSGTLKQQPT